MAGTLVLRSENENDSSFIEFRVIEDGSGLLINVSNGDRGITRILIPTSWIADIATFLNVEFLDD